RQKKHKRNGALFVAGIRKFLFKKTARHKGAKRHQSVHKGANNIQGEASQEDHQGAPGEGRQRCSVVASKSRKSHLNRLHGRGISDGFKGSSFRTIGPRPADASAPPGVEQTIISFNKHAGFKTPSSNIYPGSFRGRLSPTPSNDKASDYRLAPPIAPYSHSIVPGGFEVTS